MKKIIIWSSIVLVVAGLAVGAYLWLNKPQVIQLSDGTKLTLLGVEYGTHHKYPTSNVKGAHVSANSFDTPEKSLIVWILQEHKPNQWPNYQTLVYDRAETACVGNWSGNSQQIKNGMEIAGLELKAFPRRDSKLILRFQTWGPHGQKIDKAQFVISNPVRSSTPGWTAPALPQTQSDGDLDVTLTKLDFGVRGFNSGAPSKDPATKAVLAAFHTEQNGQVATNWQPIHITTSDATGNKVDNNSWSTPNIQTGDPSMTYQWGLWPGESAWKIKVEMSRTTGFADNELWTVTNIPVTLGSQQDLWGYDNNGRRKKTAFAETDLNGIHLQIFPVLRFNDQGPNDTEKRGGFRIATDTDPSTNGFRMTALKVTDENGKAIQTWNAGSSGNSFSFQIQNMRNAKAFNITVALHKSRFVEFTAKPSKEP